MSVMEELFNKYGCEKIWHSYSDLYEADFEPMRNDPIIDYMKQNLIQFVMTLLTF